MIAALIFVALAAAFGIGWYLAYRSEPARPKEDERMNLPGYARR